MANTKISELPNINTISDTAEILITDVIDWVRHTYKMLWIDLKLQLTWNWIESIVSNKVWKTTTVTITETNSTITYFYIEDWLDWTWAWDMMASTYDPTSVEWDAFDMDNMAQGTTNKFVSAAQLTVLENTSWINTWDQDLSSYATKTWTETLTNKRINPRVISATSYTTDTGTALTVADCDMFVVTAQAWALKLNNPWWTPTNWQKLIVRIKDNWTARALTYDTQFRSMWINLPSTTIVNKTLYMWFIYNSDDTKRDLIAVAQEA